MASEVLDGQNDNGDHVDPTRLRLRDVPDEGVAEYVRFRRNTLWEELKGYSLSRGQANGLIRAQFIHELFEDSAALHPEYSLEEAEKVSDREEFVVLVLNKTLGRHVDEEHYYLSRMQEGFEEGILGRILAKREGLKEPTIVSFPSTDSQTK